MENEHELQSWFIKSCRDVRLRATRDSDGTAHVVGRRGDIYAYGIGKMAFCLFGQTVGMKRSIIRRYVPQLMVVDQDGDSEATFLFKPELLPDVARVARCRFKRVLSEDARSRVSALLAQHRFKPRSE